jgi:phenylacetate-CoA ligase
VDAISTGGRGGEPLTFYIGARRSAVEYAYLVAGWERVGFRVGDRQAVFRGRVVGPDAEGLRHEWDPLLRHHVYSTFHMSEADIGRNMAHLASIGPCFLHVYPSSVDALARYLQRAGRTGPSNVRGILAESEIVYPQQRSLAEEMFACRYFSSYGHTEKLVAAAECEHSSNYHVWPTYGYFELLDERGHAVTTPGERGEIVGTGFINKVVPFVRYRTGDYATYVGDRCPQCGREQTLIADIRGHRVQEFLVALDGSLVPWTALNMHDDTFRSVRQFQFHQDTPGQATLRLAPVNGLPDSERDRILASLNRKLCGRVALRAELVDHIALTPRGKAIYVDQRTPGVQPSRSEG